MAKLKCYFRPVCESPDLDPVETVRVEKAKYRGFGTLPESAPAILEVCSECADRWDEMLGYVDDLDAADLSDRMDSRTGAHEEL